MLEGLYSGAAGMLAQQQRLDALANDIANLSTPGYKHLRVGFRDLLYRQDGPAALGGVETGSGAAAVSSGRSFAPGALRQTGEPLDIAIQGRGFFRVRRSDGTVALTRDGSFKVDARGEVVTAAGEPLVPPIRLPAGAHPQQVQVGVDPLADPLAGATGTKKPAFGANEHGRKLRRHRLPAGQRLAHQQQGVGHRSRVQRAMEARKHRGSRGKAGDAQGIVEIGRASCRERV